jgi:pyridoxamine 5'-phosphate oxidase
MVAMSENRAESGDLAGFRRSYRRSALDESALCATWLEQLERWFAEAVAELGDLEANAISLATVDDAGHPAVRTVLAKGIDERGVTFYTNYDSAKGHDLAARPYAAIVFLWQPQERQVRLSGPVVPVPETETAEYFASRPRGSQLGAWASPQSEVIASREVLEARLAEVTAQFDGADVPPPPRWGGFRLEPDMVEFWQGRPDRLHDRLRFRRQATGSHGRRTGTQPKAWVVERLAP